MQVKKDDLAEYSAWSFFYFPLLPSRTFLHYNSILCDRKSEKVSFIRVSMDWEHSNTEYFVESEIFRNVVTPPKRSENRKTSESMNTKSVCSCTIYFNKSKTSNKFLVVYKWQFTGNEPLWSGLRLWSFNEVGLVVLEG